MCCFSPLFFILFKAHAAEDTHFSNTFLK